MIKQAIPTDFMGIRFRSKSEAMFANMLEHMGHKWFYEPNFLEVGDYTPDFISIPDIRNRMFVNVIEYKPGVPTKAYFERLLRKSHDMYKRLGKVPQSFSVVSINFFEPFNARCWSAKPGAWTEIGESGFTEEVFNSVRSYRYDLDHSVEVLPEQNRTNWHAVESSFYRSRILYSSKYDDSLKMTFELTLNNGDKAILRRVFELWSSDEEKMTVARKDFTILCRSVGLVKLKDTSELDGLQVWAFVRNGEIVDFHG